MLTIKPHSARDIPLRVKWLNDPVVSRYVGETPGKKTTRKKQAEWFQAYQKNREKKFFTIFVDGVPIGFMGFSNISKTHRHADLFLAIGESAYRGKGYGEMSLKWLLRFGFQELKLHKINLGVIDANLPAVALYKKMGFRVEGTMRDEVRIGNTWHAMLSMAIFEK